jgi:uncharacterized protein YecE (DUF72 family)
MKSSADSPTSPLAIKGLQIGPAGWSYPDWNGIVYPERRPRGWHALDWLSCYFNLCEINTSFYRIPSADSARSWVRRVAGHPDFVFTAKVWEGFTHSAGPDGRGDYSESEIDAFRAFADVLRNADRLGCLLMQFPWSFRPSPGNWDRLSSLVEAFSAYPLAIEVRHQAWHTHEYIEWLRARQIAFVNIDQPLFSGSLPPTEEVTARFWYIRLHGRNRANWFAGESSVEERYDYLYSREELGPWIERARRMRQSTPRGLIVANNHRRGQAIVNGMELSTALDRPIPTPPQNLLRAYPQSLADLPHGKAAFRPPPPEQLELF